MGTQGTTQKVEVEGKVRGGEENQEGRVYGAGDQGGRACVVEGEVEDDVARPQGHDHHHHPLARVPSG